MQSTRFTQILARTGPSIRPQWMQKSWMAPAATPFVVRAYSSAPHSVSFKKDENSPEVAIMTLHQSAFSHETSKELIKVRTSRLDRYS